MSDIKEKLHRMCMDYVEERIATAQHAITAARESANDDTKSSAGDKYETGREMMQQEIDRNRKQLEESQKLKLVLEQIDPVKPTDIVQNGSLVITNYGKFYISISRGQISAEDSNYFAVSSVSPIGLKLMKQKAGFEFDFNGKLFRIEKVE
ncbi:3-oxoacyl-ACP synthase [Daejeonella sp.]|uniref:3-oxoacyl-ACP synthase n=1 Tax=Daejeonella sp. TaxID=2805397 RepID=UPI0030C4D311